MSADTSVDPFADHRNLLFTVAYELLGSAADAEDVVQDAWLKWDAVDQEEVHNPRAYLVRIVTRTALDHLRSVSRRREEYVGPWLPEPLVTTRDVAEDVELAESVSMAMLLVLETLSPTERAVFVLREVFGLEYDELAVAVDKSQDAVRQIAHRARSHVTSRRPRADVSRAEAEDAVVAFRRALETGDLQALADTLAPDVVALADGGGIKQALPQPVQGADKVAKLYLAGLTRFGDRLTFETLELNGWPALLARLDGEVDSVLAFAVLDGRITGLYGVRNPEKLSRLTGETSLSR
ncbi:RNA polymerase sigma-70 factor [Ornithinimicrobium sp. F0845]|uniref:RNA polymerase sigma-70 factor n=1 Tax=Ornithinimicrobium sp. F0845 TaxID=2926412 RepID=UPI001FF44A20|nr:RNA polymerase sigma-70 factor [Ornithinimicrobium sp. F0845]MCK0111456.1 RNA polymerase sigma-70 factor [Ornithinimicrobium sp. F0845]